MTINEMKAGIEKRYFEWLYELVCGKWEPRNLSFRRLLTFLYDTQFVPDNEMDCNRAVDGENLRGRFAEECNDIPGAIPENNVSVTFQGKPCNMLEMMVALALRCEETIMEDADIGNRTGQWFWSMIVSLGLASMDDNRFDYCFIFQGQFFHFCSIHRDREVEDNLPNPVAIRLLFRE